MRYSELFGRTVREAPKDARTTSHRLLHRGGFIRQIAAGRYAFLPLGFRVWEKISRIVDEEMRKIGSQRVTTPTLHPIEFWQATNRDEAFGEEMLIVEDHHGATFAIGATAEGLMVEMVKSFKPSYRDLPVVIHQFVQKFRDEKRPRGGLLRVREFMMKDAYSFCATEEELLKCYQAFFDAYLTIGKRLDLDVIPVLAHSGAIGGDYNHEFMVFSEAGEDTVFVCDQCDYAANLEKAEFKREKINLDEEMRPFEIVEQPEWVRTMEDNVKHYNLPKSHFLKNVVYTNAKGEVVIGVIRGDLEVNPVKLAEVMGEEKKLEVATDEDLVRIGTKSGYVHSWGHKKAIYVGDLSLKTVRNFIGGQKEKNTDSINVNYGRDFESDFFGDIANAEDGKKCPRCEQGKLQAKKAIEFGHVFKQDHFYTGPMKGNFVDRDGQEKPMWMGAYGIGIGRAMAVIVETHHDERGIVWPKSVAPFRVHLIALTNEDGRIGSFAEECYQRLMDNHVETLYDDRRGVSAGIRFGDADLIGCPVRLVVSEKTLKKKKVEWKKRGETESILLELEEVVKRLG